MGTKEAARKKEKKSAGKKRGKKPGKKIGGKGGGGNFDKKIVLWESNLELSAWKTTTLTTKP